MLYNTWWLSCHGLCVNRQMGDIVQHTSSVQPELELCKKIKILGTGSSPALGLSLQSQLDPILLPLYCRGLVLLLLPRHVTSWAYNLSTPWNPLLGFLYIVVATECYLVDFWYSSILLCCSTTCRNIILFTWVLCGRYQSTQLCAVDPLSCGCL